jgi:regulation of enolase protein 1 (concanavalin A-like superfamily)
VTLTGSGRDIWNTADGFRYYYQPLTGGDREIIVRVASLQNTNGWAKAGIMVRESLEPGSAHAWISISTEHGAAYQWREMTGGETRSTAPTEDGPPPRWLKLAFQAEGVDSPIPRRVLTFVSHDGVTWTPMSSAYMGNAWAYIGLAVTSHNDGTLCAAQFDNLRVITPPPAPTALQVLHRGPNGDIDLGWSFPAGEADRFEIAANAQRTSNHDWRIVGTATGTARQARINIGNGDSEDLKITAFRDFVQSAPARWGFVRATITPELYVIAETSSSVTLRIHEPQFGMNGPQSGPWSLERSSDGVNFVEIANGLRPPSGWDTDYIDGIPSGSTRFYRARQLLTNGDNSAYSNIVSATARTSGTPPAAPTNLTATALSPTSVRLAWTDNSSDEDNFEVGRSTDNVTYFNVAVVGPNTTSFTDNTASPGTFYYYRIGAFNDGMGTLSNIATVTTPGTSTGPGWVSQDVGSTGAAGSMTVTGDSITVRGSGADIWGGADSFHFAYQPLNGAGTLTARVVSITNTNGWAKAGLMIRDSVAAGSRNIFVAATPDWHGIVGQHRDTQGGTTAQVPGPAVRPPYWLRLSRSSDFTRLSTSSDGVTWTEFASWSSSLISPNALIGFAVTSHANGSLCTATFDNVSLVGSTTSPPSTSPAAPTALTATPQSNSQIELAWSDQSTNETGFQVERSGSATGPFALVATMAANATRYVDGGLASSTAYYYRVRAINDAGASAYSNVANAMTAAASTWASADIGNVGRAGSDSASGNTITIHGAGADIWGNADAFRFVSRSWTGDGVVEARLLSMTNTNGWAKAGVMIRESTAAGARNVFVALTPTWHGSVAQARSNTGDVTTQAAGPVVNAPYWVRIARTGNTFTVSTSTDGVSWTTFATFNVTMPATAHFGFAVTSHDTSQLNQAIFEDPYVGPP